MTKEIKFRVWNKEDKTMHMPESVNIQIYWFGFMRYTISLISSGTICAGQQLENQYCILMQFTGLLDKNGKEIYEGDIVKIPRYKNKYAILKIIEIGAYGIFFHYIEGGIGGEFYSNLSRRNEIEVIGNIYENDKRN